jgi:ribonuclease BN (tRNA processing enzyme)
MRLTVIGYAGSFPGPDSPASCYLVEAEGFRMLLDLGSGALGPLQRHIGLYDVDAICLSHLHVDHYMDMCPYWVVRNYAPNAVPPPIPVYGPAGTANRLADAYGLERDPGMTGVFDFLTLDPGRFVIGPLRVTVDHVNHPVETFGFRIEHAGRSLAYSADTGESPALVKLARSADVLLCEASFIDGPARPPNLHLTGRAAGEHAARADAGHLVLTHLTPGNDPACTLAEAQSTFRGPVSLAFAGRVIDLGGLSAAPGGGHR